MPELVTLADDDIRTTWKRSTLPTMEGDDDATDAGDADAGDADDDASDEDAADADDDAADS